MPDINKILLELLCSAMWDKDADPLVFDDVDLSKWQLLSDVALKQSVSTLINDKILSLPQQCLPPHNHLLQLMAQISQTEKQNTQLNSLLSHISNEYTSEGIPFVVLKGPANAYNYPKPLLRAVGDLDLYLYTDNDYERANKWVEQKNLKYHVDLIRDGHRAYELDGFLIENHRYITFFERKKYNRILQGHLDAVIADNSFSTIDIYGTNVKVLPPDINGCYIFQHLFFHFIHAGVGFKQYCDWVLFLAKNREAINEQKFTEIAKSLDLLYPMQLFAHAAIKYLKAPENIFPFQLGTFSRYSDMIIEDILSGGNFGFHHSGRSASLWINRWRSFSVLAKRTIKFMPVAPSYSLITPVYKVLNRIKLTLKGH